MEYIAHTIRAYGKGVMGNLRHRTDIMLSFQIEKEGEIHDIFLSKEKAESLQKELGERIEENKPTNQK